MDIKSDITHTDKALQKSIHTCRLEGCKSFNYYRQANKIFIKKDIEDFLIRHYQSLFIIKSKNNKKTLLIKYWLRLSYILLRYGSVGWYKDSNNNAIFGQIVNAYYNYVGDMVQFDIRPIIIGQLAQGLLGNSYFNFSSFKNDQYGYIELPRRKGLKEQYYNIIQATDDAFDNIRINQDNAMIKYYYDAGTNNGDDQIAISVSPSINNMGIAIVSKKVIPSAIKEDYDDAKNSNEQIKKLLTESQGIGLTPNNYKDDTDSSWFNFQNCWKLLCLFSGIRENKDIKRTNLTNAEVESNNFSYDLAENYTLSIIQDLVDKWNIIFNEDNYVEKTAEISYYESGSGEPSSNSESEGEL